MLKNYIIIAVRNLFKHKTISFIHLFGFTVSVALCLLLFTYVQHELSYDQFHENSDRTYRVTYEWFNKQGESAGFAATPPYVLGNVLSKEMPEIKQILRIRENPIYMEVNNQKYFEKSVLIVRGDFFDVFQLPLKIGNPNVVLAEPYCAVISQNMAQKFFGDASPIGQIINEKVKVTGVLDHVPDNTILQYDIIIRMPEVERDNSLWFQWNGFGQGQIFFVTHEPHSKEYLANKINSIASNYTPEQYNRIFQVQTLQDIYLRSQDYIINYFHAGVGEYIFLYSGITIFLFIMACINFISLSLGLSSYRIKEVGMRKVLGAKRGQVLFQFLGEIFILSLLSLILGYMLAQLLLPYFNQFVNQQLTIHFSWGAVSFFGGIVVLMILIAGLIPAWLVSRYNAVFILRTRSTIGGSQGVGKLLVVLQFIVAIFFISAAMILTNQMQFIERNDVGFNREDVIILPTHYGVPTDRLLDYLRNSANEHPPIASVTGSSHNLGLGEGRGAGLNEEYGGQSVHYSVWGADFDFVETLGIEITRGRSFSRDYSGDTKNSVLVNEAFIRKAGLENPLAHHVDGRRIVGIMKNIHHRPLQHQIDPLVISHSDAGWGNRYIYVKTTGEQTEETINWLRSKWGDVAPATLFEYHFLDDQFKSNYRRYFTISSTMQFAGGSTIIIALMGVLGMTLLSVKKREQEISIRKVLGARIANILTLIARQYLWFILFASMVAAPLAYFGMEYWLQNFAYRITVEYWMFLIPAGALLLLTMIIVSLHGVKVASYNPAVTLRNE